MFHKLLCSSIMLFIIAAYAYSEASLNGYIQTDNRMSIEELDEISSVQYRWNENRFGLKIESSLSDKLHGFGELQLRSHGFPKISRIADLQDNSKNGITPLSLELKEAYFDAYGFLTKKLDMRLGKQIIVWGKADKINPTNNLCPDDLEDMFDFGAKIGVNALKASFYQKIAGTELTFSGVFIPVFTPSALPSAEWTNALMGDLKLPTTFAISNSSEDIMLPEDKLGESSSYGLKLSAKLLDYDLSLSYYDGRDKMPIASYLLLSPLDEKTANLTVGMKYPEIRVIGADLSGEVGSVGLWAEGAMIMPKNTETLRVILGPNQTELGSSIALEDDPYLKFVIGGDYYFKHGFYLNMQFARGFIHERGKDNINNYLVSRLEYKFHNDEIKLSPISFAVTVSDWDDVKRNYGLAYTPEVSYTPEDNLEIIIGAILLNGAGESIFSKVSHNDEFYLKAKVTF